MAKVHLMPEICGSAPALFLQLSLTSQDELEIRRSPEVAQKYAPVLLVRSFHHWIMVVWPYSDSGDLVPGAELLPKRGGPQICAVGKTLAPSLA